MHFDLVFSNSVIEHLSTHADQEAMAREVARVGRSYWVQTPDPRFPVEPHYMSPFVHWLPKSIRRRIARNFTVWGIVTRPTPKYIDDRLDEIRLISKKEFQGMFPDGTIMVERFAGIPKSMIALRNAAQGAKS
jgi:hypothetical protein